MKQIYKIIKKTECYVLAESPEEAQELADEDDYAYAEIFSEGDPQVVDKIETPFGVLCPDNYDE